MQNKKKRQQTVAINNYAKKQNITTDEAANMYAKLNQTKKRKFVTNNS